MSAYSQSIYELADATRINKIVEQFVLLAPEQYLWVHRRFKNRPDGESDVYDLPVKKSQRKEQN